MFLGIFRTYFTGKNRIVLPKKFRKELSFEDKFYLIKGYNGEIWGFDNKQWHKEAEIRLSIPLTEEEGRIKRRKFFSQSEECNLDAQGRFIIPGDLILYSEIKTEVVLLGAGDHFEIWNPERFAKIVQENL